MISCLSTTYWYTHDDVIKWKHFPRYWLFAREIHPSPVISPHKGQWRRVLMLSLIWAWINGWVNNGEAGDLRRHRGRFDVTVMMDFTGLSIQYAVWHLLVIEICYASINLRACVRNYIPITLWNVITYPYPEVRYNTPVKRILWQALVSVDRVYYQPERREW